MAISATTIAEVRTGGSDTANGGLFDPGQTAGMFTDGAATSATGNSPVFTSASYNFTSTGGVSNTGDVGAWLYIASGTNWTPGWYQIVSVASNAATLSAAAGAAFLSSSSIWNGPSTAAGCATTASPTGATWTIDYSQQAAAQLAYTDLTTAGAGLTVSSTAHPFGKQQVGNGLIIASGTNFTAGVYVIASVSGVTATLLGAANSSTGAGSANGVAGMGGAFKSPGKAGLVAVAGNDLFIASGTYSITSASANVAGGCVSWPAAASSTSFGRIYGYQTTRGDGGTKPLLQASGISTFTLVTLASGNRADNLSVDGASLTSSRGFSLVGGTELYRCKAANCTNTGVSGTNAALQVLCEATGCSTQPAFIFGTALACTAHDNTVTGFKPGNVQCQLILSAATNNTGASSVGINMSSANTLVDRCIAYGNGTDGILATASSTPVVVADCLSVGNGVSAAGYGFNCGSMAHVYLYNCAGYNNTSGLVNTAVIPLRSQVGLITLTDDPFTNKAGNDFSLNNNTGAGAACRAAGIPGSTTALKLPGLSTNAYPDVGAVQHQDAGGASVIVVNQTINKIIVNEGDY